jgi:hypothetical protein
MTQNARGKLDHKVNDGAANADGPTDYHSYNPNRGIRKKTTGSICEQIQRAAAYVRTSAARNVFDDLCLKQCAIIQQTKCDTRGTTVETMFWEMR